MRGDAILGPVESLYLGHREWLGRWLERRLRCPDRAAEISQDTFCRLLERRPDTMPSSPRSYLVTIARRLLIDDARRQKIERALLDSQALYGENADVLTPERILEAAQLLDRMLKAIETLPALTRRVLILRRLDGLEQQQIASRLDMSARTVRRHIVTATMHLHMTMNAQ